MLCGEKNKRPQLLGGKSWGLIDLIKYPPFPAEGLRDQSELSRFPGLRLPNPHAFPDDVQWLKNRSKVRGKRPEAKLLKSPFYYRSYPRSSCLDPVFLWVSFRSQLRGSGRFILPSLTVSRYFKKFGQPPVKAVGGGFEPPLYVIFTP